MLNRRFLPLVLAFLTISFYGSTQEVIAVDASTLERHVDHRVLPSYPPIAQAARVQGTVVFQIQVGTTGGIESVKVENGPPMLLQAGLDNVKQWTYHPFIKDGSPVEVSGTASIQFSLGGGSVSFHFGPGEQEPPRGEKKITDRYIRLSAQCLKDFSAQRDYPATAAVCRQAAETVEEFAPDVHFIDKRAAFVGAAWALVDNRDLKAALGYAVKAVDVVKLGHDDNAGSHAAYWVKSYIEGKLGDLVASDLDLTIAEDYERKEIVWAEQVGFEPSDRYKRALAQDLRFHAQVLQSLNRPDEAQKKLDEAAKPD